MMIVVAYYRYTCRWTWSNRHVRRFRNQVGGGWLQGVDRRHGVGVLCVMVIDCDFFRLKLDRGISN